MSTEKIKSSLPSFELLHKLFDSLHEVVCVFDKEWRFIYINKASYNLWGYHPEELIGVPCYGLIVPEDRDGSLNAGQDAYNGAAISTFENRYYHKDGRIIHMFWEGGWDFGDDLLYSTGRDVSEQKKAEKIEQMYKKELQQTKGQLENLLERITDGFIGVDHEARVIYWNKAAEELSQIRQEVVLGKILWDVFPEQGLKYKEYYEHVKAANKPMTIELYADRIDKWVEVNTYVSGSGLSIYFRDITEKKMLQEQLRKEKELQQKRITSAVLKATEQERAYVGKELHDNVNQVLTTVKLYAELCLNSDGNTEQLLKKSIQLLQLSINEIRSLSKQLSAPSLGKIGLKESVAELIDAVNETNRVMVLYQHAIGDIEVSEEMHIAIYRILQEHLTNILKHAAASKVEVHLKVED
ncbi:MAG TPA: PAS domain S-box protein, partial [Chitinophagaceae bacterium]|nr:PAS domain S-box protein [Chitinophagaceae bacterium]